MINEERVIEMSHLAFYDDKTNRHTEEFETYYGRDYVGKEVLKSIFTGTFAYIGLAILVVLGMADNLESAFDSMDLAGTAVKIVLSYLVFELAYLVVTVMVYRRKFKAGRAGVKTYAKHLKRISKMYTREEKNKG